MPSPQTKVHFPQFGAAPPQNAQLINRQGTLTEIQGKESFMEDLRRGRVMEGGREKERAGGSKEGGRE